MVDASTVVAVALGVIVSAQLGYAIGYCKHRDEHKLGMTSYAKHVRAVQQYRTKTLREALYVAQSLCRSRECDGCPCKPKRCNQRCILVRLSDEYFYLKTNEF